MQFIGKNIAIICLALITLSSGCSQIKGPEYSQEDTKNLQKCIIAQKLQIVAPFTKPKSFDEDVIPDGIDLFLKASDQQDDPVKIAGNIVIQLYAFRNASADPKGQLIETWNYNLTSVNDQVQYWNRNTRMYEIPLSLDIAKLSQARKFVMLARYINPWNEHIENQEIIDLTDFYIDTKRYFTQSDIQQ